MAADELNRLDFDAARGKRLLIALSGGADSVALTYLLAEKREKYNFTLAAAHYNHHIRPLEAELDADFCAELCRKLEIPLYCGEGDVPAEAKRLRVGLETAARDMRYRFLYKTMEKYGFDLLALAHHLDDQAETVLMRLFRGAGPEGICGMEMLHGRLYRPLLRLRKSELSQYLMRKGVNWREDSSNAVADNPRNALRLNVLPQIERCYPSAAKSIGRYAELARMESDYLSRLSHSFAEKSLKKLYDGWQIDLSDGFEEVLLRRVLRNLCGASLESQKLEEIMLLCGEKRGKLEISGEILAEKTPSALYILSKERKRIESVPLTLGDTAFGSCVIRCERSTCTAHGGGGRTEALDEAALAGACIRTRMDGDRIRPLGMSGEKLLSDYLTDRGIDRPLRETLPLLAVGKRVIWVGGVGISEDAKIRPDTRTAVKITYITDENAEGTK